MPYIKKRGITYGGFPNATVGSKDVSVTVPSSIKQLIRVGGTQEFAPVTIPEAVKFSEGGSLETTVNSIATIESSSTASKAYAVGDFLVSGGQLYTVIADIDLGETFVVDTNIEATSVGEELSELNSGLSNKIGYVDVDLSGTAITSADSGWYYAEVPVSVPTGARLMSVATMGSWDASVFYFIGNAGVTLRSPTSKTLGNNRIARVFYYRP